MKYIDAKNEIKKEYEKYNNSNFEEIDYCFAEIMNKSVTMLQFCEISLKDFEKAKDIILKHLSLNKPLQKLFNRAYFYGLEFYVNENVLTPRFDSEILVENALKFEFNSILDLCSGSGCLGLSIKKNRQNASLTLGDISEKALECAEINAKNLKIPAKFVKTDMFSNITGQYDLIVCNPPYIATSEIEKLSSEVKDFDPILALDGGEDGLKFYKILLKNLDNFLTEKGKCLIEIGYDQGFLLDLFKQKFENVKLVKDYNNQDRLLIINKENELC